MVPLSIDLKRSKNSSGSSSGGTTTVVNNRNGSIYASINPVIETNSSSDDDDDGSSIEEGVMGNRKNIRGSSGSGVREDKSSNDNRMEHHVYSSRHKK